MLTLSAVWSLGILGSLSACPFPVLESSQDRGRVSMDFYPHPSSSPLLNGSNACISVLVNGNGVMASVRKKHNITIYTKAIVSFSIMGKPPPIVLAKSPAEVEITVNKNKQKLSQHFLISVPSLMLLCQTSYALAAKLQLVQHFFVISLTAMS